MPAGREARERARSRRSRRRRAAPTASGKATLSGETAMPDDAHAAEAARRRAVADVDVPLAREAALDHDLAGAAVEVAAGDDRVAAAAAEHELDRAAVATTPLPPASWRLVDLAAVRARLRGSAGAQDRASTAGAALGAEAGDHVGQVGLRARRGRSRSAARSRRSTPRPPSPTRAARRARPAAARRGAARSRGDARRRSLRRAARRAGAARGRRSRGRRLVVGDEHDRAALARAARAAARAPRRRPRRRGCRSARRRARAAGR